MTLLLIVGIIALLIVGGCLLTGTIMFKELFIRKKDDGSYNLEIVTQALESMKEKKRNPPKRDKFDPTVAFSAHVNDPVIMIPILEAKLRWLHLLDRGEIQKISITAQDGIQLAGYLWNNSEKATIQPQKIAILIHGYTDSAAGMAYLAEEYYTMGFSVLSVDCRAHGKSGGKNITMGYTDAKDVACWVEKILQLKGRNTKILLHGVSMGAVSVIRSLIQKHVVEVADNLIGVAADCGFSSAKDQLIQQGKLLFGDSILIKIGTYWMIAGLSAVNFLRCGFFYSQDSAKQALITRRELATAKVPLVLFHGEEDAFISPEMAHQLEQAAGATNVLKIHVSGAPHIGSYFYDKDGYLQALKKNFCI